MRFIAPVDLFRSTSSTIEAISLLKGRGDWLPVVSLDLETYLASVVGADMRST